MVIKMSTQFSAENEIIVYTDFLPEGTEQNLSFMDLLLDERLCAGKIEYPAGIHSEIGDYNTLLTAKQEYEFLLRAASLYPVKAIGAATTTSEEFSADAWDGYRTDCYIVGKYERELLDCDCFNPVVETLLAEASRLPDTNEAAAWLEKMVSHAPEFYEIDDNTRPVLIYLCSDVCYNILNVFAHELAQALRYYHQPVEIFDVEKEGNQALTRLIDRHYKAIIGVQTYVFSILMRDGVTNLHDLIIGPKFNLILDHPAWMKDHVAHAPENCYLLTHDRNYLAFAKRYYPQIADCIHLPPGGILPAAPVTIADKCYEITFIGTFHDYRIRLPILSSYERSERFLAGRFLHIMRRFPDMPAEDAMRKALEYYHIELSDEAFLELFYKMNNACFCVYLYYREKIIRTLLESGFELHVFGDSWKGAPFAKHKNLIIHPAVDITDSLRIMQKSWISLNIMSWHKDGLTERVLNAMLCHSVVVSDTSTMLDEAFQNNEDIVLFQLSQIESLPAKLHALLKDKERLWEIAENGYCKAAESHLWKHRAKKLLDFINR